MPSSVDAVIRPQKLILDTDPGVDDALALLMLQGLSGIDLLALTTVFGNADTATTTRNALFLRRRMGLTVPVHQGAAAPLVRPRRPAPVHVHGRNGLGDIALEMDMPFTPDSLDAPGAIARAIRAHPGLVTLLAIGPLTNLALALRLDPGIAPLTRRVVVMGGAFGRDGCWGNVTPFAEANIHNDPEAAAAVLAAPWPVTLVGLDVTMRCRMPDREARWLRDHGGESGRFTWDISRGYAAAYARHDGIDGCCLHDVAALAFVAAPSLFKTQSCQVDLVTDGPELGRTILLPETGAHHQVCVDVDGAGVFNLFRDTVLDRP